MWRLPRNERIIEAQSRRIRDLERQLAAQNSYIENVLPKTDKQTIMRIPTDETQIWQLRYEEVKKQLQAALEVIKFYGNENNYNHFPTTGHPECNSFVGFVIENEAGDKARQFLKEMEKNNE